MNTIVNEYRYKTVMVIDDSESDRYIAAYYLKKYNISSNIISFENAAEALKYLQQSATAQEELPSIIFLDIRMPVMDGFEFLQHFEQLPSHVHEACTIVMISSSVDPIDHARIKISPYVTRFISKPLNKESLKDI